MVHDSGRRIYMTQIELLPGPYYAKMLSVQVLLSLKTNNDLKLLYKKHWYWMHFLDKTNICKEPAAIKSIPRTAFLVNTMPTSSNISRDYEVLFQQMQMTVTVILHFKG